MRNKEASGQFLAGGDMNLSGGEIDNFIKRKCNDGFIECRGAAVAVIDEGSYHRQARRTVSRNTRCSVEREPTALAHPRHEEARIEAADHVAFALVLAGAEIATVQDARVGVDGPARPTFLTGRKARGR